MGVYSTTVANAYADKIKAVYEYLDEIRKVADRLTPVEDLTSFQAQIEDIHAQLDLLVEASTLIATATPTGEAILTGSVQSIKTLLEIGVIPADLIRQADLDAALAGLGSGVGDQLAGMVNNISTIDLNIAQLEQYRVLQQSAINGLQISYDGVAAGLETNQTNIETALSRLTVQEQFATLLDQRLASIDQSLVSTATGIQANNQTLSGHTASISSFHNAIAMHTASIDSLSSSLVDANTGISSNASALSLMETTIVGLGQDITAQSQQTVSLKSSIGGSGNLLPNADFVSTASGWTITVAEHDWASTVLTVDTFPMPEEVHSLEVLGIPAPQGQIVVESPTMLLEGGRHYIVSGYPCVDNGTVVLSYKVFDSLDAVIAQGACPPTFNGTTSASFSNYVRAWVPLLTAQNAVKMRLYLTVTGNGDWLTRGALFRPMVERAWAEQEGPGAWTPNMSGSLDALEGSISLVEAALVNEIITSANKNAATAASLNTLSARMQDVETDASGAVTAVQGLTARVSSAEGTISSQGTSLTNLQAQVNSMDQDTGGYGSAIAELDTRVDQTEQDISSQGQAITALQNSVTSANKIFVQNTAPATAGRTEGDLWIHTGEGNKPYTLSGGQWVARQDAGKNSIFVQNTAPIAKAINDLWIHTGDNNKPFRWNGSTWVDISDARTTANSSAISTLQSRASAIEGVNSSQAGAITALESTVNNPTTGLTATASAVNSLSTRVTDAEGVNNAQASSLQSLNTTVNGHSSTITTHAQSINGISAKWGLQLDVNGYVSGMSTLNNGQSASIVFTADQFRLVTPGYNPRTLFSINSNVGTGLSSDLYLANGRIVLDTGTHMKVTGIGFGVNNEFIEWYGPKMDIALCSRTNAIIFATRTGAAYFGGSLSTGALRNAVSSTIVTIAGQVETGQFSSNGGARVVAYSLAYDNTAWNSQSAGNTANACTVTLQRSVNGGGWQNLGSFQAGGQTTSTYDPELGLWLVSVSLAGSATYTDNTGGNGPINYRVVMSNNTGTWPLMLNNHPGYQSLTVASSEG